MLLPSRHVLESHRAVVGTLCQLSLKHTKMNVLGIDQFLFAVLGKLPSIQ